MKPIWTIISVLAVANLVALLAFAGWLGASGRLTEARLEQVREVFRETAADEQARLDREAAEAEEAAAAAAAEAVPEGPISTAAQTVGLRTESTQIARLADDRARREIDDLRRSLITERTLLDRERAQLESDRASFDRQRAEIAEIEGDEQFRKSLETIAGMKPKDAMATLLEMEGSGDRARVVSYLNAMDERVRTKVMTEFVKAGETALAAGLLEAIRVRGLGPQDTEGAAG